METTTFVIVIGTTFTLFILAMACMLVILAQKRRMKSDLKFQEAETNKQKDILEMVMKTQEEERKRVGLELHDDLGPTFSAINLKLNNVLQRVKVYKDQKLIEIVTRIQKDTVESIQKFSNVSRLLYPVVLQRHGIEGAMNNLVEMLTKSTKIQIDLKMDFESNLNPDFELALFRICQELCNNGVKHSGGNHISLNLHCINNSFIIDYKDNGKGFAIDTIKRGIGLESIQSRVLAFGGTQNIQNKIPLGLHIQIVFNYDNIRNS